MKTTKPTPKPKQTPITQLEIKLTLTIEKTLRLIRKRLEKRAQSVGIEPGKLTLKDLTRYQ